MCELCDKQVAAIINNRNADSILKMSQAATNLYQANYSAEAKKVADALVKLLPQEAKTSGETSGQKEKSRDPEKYTAEHLQIAKLLGVQPSAIAVHPAV